MIKNNLCGAIPSPADERDWCLPRARVASASFPAEFRPAEPEAKYQQAGSCAGHSGAYAMECIHGIEFSPGYAYGRREDGEYQGEGRTIRSVCQVLVDHGDVPYFNFKADSEMPAIRASVMRNLAKLDKLAQKYKLAGYGRIHTVDEIKAARLGGAAAIICVPVSRMDADKRGIFRCDSPVHGYHAMCLWGWGRVGGKEMFRVLNSWGQKWGDNGACWISAEDVLRTDEVFVLTGDRAEIKLLKLLKAGSKGVQVDLLQQTLQDAGYAVAVDGVYGLVTETAVKRYQTDHGLKPSGTVGTATWRALGL